MGKFVGFRGEFSIFKVRVSDNMPRKDSFWTASCFIGEMASYKNWGDLAWGDLREQYQSEYCDIHCVWISKSDDPTFFSRSKRYHDRILEVIGATKAYYCFWTERSATEIFA